MDKAAVGNRGLLCGANQENPRLPTAALECEMTLNDLPLGRRARILDVAGDDAIALRLMEMGLTEDEPIEFLGKAPLGDPLEFLIRGYRISLRQTEAARVIVEPLSDVC